ncbi:MAG: CDP-diacylglycerol--glycerol-3-phosphate 3-phosphatidyltransferase [Pseudomonadota bacterium]
MLATLPNLLTLMRILAAPALALILMLAQSPAAFLWAFMLFAVAAFTDFLDGWLARRLKAVSAMGRMLDPIADKVMVVIALATLMAVTGPSPALVLPCVAIFLREVLISGLREFLGDVKLPVTFAAKAKTTVQMLAIGGLLLAGALPAAAWLQFAALALLWIAAGLTILTGIDYLRQAGPHLKGRG